MKRKKLSFPVCLVLFSLSLLLLLPISAIAEGDGAWTTTDSPGYIFLVEEDLFNNEKHMLMTVVEPGYVGREVYWGSASSGSTYKLNSLTHDSNMVVTWQSNSDTKATVTVESCTTNCLWPPAKVVTMNKFFGDIKVIGYSRVSKTGQTECWDLDGNKIECKGTGQDGEHQYGVLPVYPPSSKNPFTIWETYQDRSWWTNNGDGTVTDKTTELTWVFDQVKGQTEKSECFSMKSWNEALHICNTLAAPMCGLTDGSQPGHWRLPNINELASVAYTIYVQPLATYHGVPPEPGMVIKVWPPPKQPVELSYVWSSTTYPQTDEAWILIAPAVFTYWYKVAPATVRCVR